ncbi:MAG: hypothetical protein DMD56_01335 [Gemmatimonadetes bacterium]|nr:MAG: hypothetical protein DMD56_01335 [Gemmatimonadota bacterium]
MGTRPLPGVRRHFRRATPRSGSGGSIRTTRSGGAGAGRRASHRRIRCASITSGRWDWARARPPSSPIRRSGPTRRRTSARSSRPCGCCGRRSESCGRPRRKPASSVAGVLIRASCSGGSRRTVTRSTTGRRAAARASSRRSGGERATCWRAAGRNSTLGGCRCVPAWIFLRRVLGLSLRWSWSIRPRCSILRFGAGAVSALAVAASGCLYGFAGGGLPNIKTVAILPFDNQTAEPALTKEVNDAVLEAFQRRLGLRLAGESNADAVVRGKVVRYDPDVPVAYQAGQQRTDVTQRQVQITIDVEILDQREGKTLWQRQGLSEVGNYAPPQEAAGRRVALDKLVNDLVDGAQSQW